MYVTPFYPKYFSTQEYLCNTKKKSQSKDVFYLKINNELDFYQIVRWYIASWGQKQEKALLYSSR